jgi:serine protease
MKEKRLWPVFLFVVIGFTFAPLDIQAQPANAVNLISGLPVAEREGRILLMLESDVGRPEAKPIEPAFLDQLSLSVGTELTWEGSTHTNGQILKLPIGVGHRRARQIAETLSLQAGVLWADFKTLDPARKAIAKSLTESESISRIVIKFKGDKLDKPLSPALMNKVINAAGMNLSVTGQTTFARILTLTIPITVEQSQVLQKTLESLSEVLYADPDRSVHLHAENEITPNDGLFWRDWHLQGPYELAGGETNGYLGAANIQSAWDLTKGQSSIGVAVLDTGILFEHPDLKRALGRQNKRYGWDMVTDIVRARDGNARDPDAQDEGTWVDQGTLCNEDEWSYASNWHGSHVGGIIAATTNNKIGVAGTNWRSKLVPVRVLAGCPNETMVDVADGILWASGEKMVPGTRPNRTPVQVMNMSFGMEMPCPSVYQESIDRALSKGISMVVSAGNSQRDVADYAPANCHGVISVASVSHVGDKAYYTNIGRGITIAAPGGQQRWPVYNKEGAQISQVVLKEWGIWSTVSSSQTTPELGEMMYSPYQGTSMAAPVVTGIISLMVSADKKHRLNPSRVRNILRETARQFPESVPVFTALKLNAETNAIEEYTWQYTQPSACTTLFAGQCGPGIVNAAAAIRAVRDLQ